MNIEQYVEGSFLDFKYEFVSNNVGSWIHVIECYYKICIKYKLFAFKIDWLYGSLFLSKQFIFPHIFLMLLLVLFIFGVIYFEIWCFSMIIILIIFQ